MVFDEFAVNAGQIDLPQINAGSRVGLRPSDDIQKLRPDIGRISRVA
jgi:hypothetical protein